MKKKIRRGLALLLVLGLSPPLAGTVRAADGEQEEERTPREVNFLSYEEAVTYFDFSYAATRWCENLGWDTATRQGDARDAILAGTDPKLIIGLATLARDTGHAGEKFGVTTAFRPACYQEVIGLHQANSNTGPYRNFLTWNGQNVTSFWWKAEQAAGWPEKYSIDLSGYDIETMDPRYFYRAALRLWDNSRIAGYIAKPGCSNHNTGTAMDVATDNWVAVNFATSFDYNGETYYMEDYGVYKPLQPEPGYAGENWHITSSPDVAGLENYDVAFAAEGEIVYALYYNPLHYGWNIESGCSVYVGSGVAVLQLRLCQLGLLEEKYITGYYCTRTMEAVKAFQTREGLGADGMCGAGTIKRLLDTEYTGQDAQTPVIADAKIGPVTAKGFRLDVTGADNDRLTAFRVETRWEDADWITRYYNAPAGGTGSLDIDIWQEGEYEIRVAARDAAGNESEFTAPDTVYVDMTPPVLRQVSVSDIWEDGFALTIRAEDNGTISGFRVRLEADEGTARTEFYESAGYGVWHLEDFETGIWTVTVTAVDVCGNESEYTFDWQYVSGAAEPGKIVTHFG